MPEPNSANPQPPDFYEFKYPYVLPQNDALNVIPPADLQTLTPLECAFVCWMIESGNPEVAVNRLIHPAVYFDTNTHGAKVLMGRPHVRDMLKKIKRDAPYLRLYNLDYVAAIIHEEVQYLRHSTRDNRFYGTGRDEGRYLGKLSIHQEEMTEVKALHDYLQLLVKMNEVAMSHNTGKDGNSTDPKSGGQDSGVDRVIAEAHAAIKAREGRTGGETGGDAPPAPPE